MQGHPVILYHNHLYWFEALKNSVMERVKKIICRSIYKGLKYSWVCKMDKQQKWIVYQYHDIAGHNYYGSSNSSGVL